MVYESGHLHWDYQYCIVVVLHVLPGQGRWVWVQVVVVSWLQPVYQCVFPKVGGYDCAVPHDCENDEDDERDGCQAVSCIVDMVYL